ncbi:MAG: hypothetical protein GXP48_09565 [Acidobacteria bacterium]|nr:hypothetical protein [Acidobacteriota bacterium]
MSETFLRFVRRTTLVLIVVSLGSVGAVLVHRMRRGLHPELVKVQTETTPAAGKMAKSQTVGVYHGFEFTESLSGKTVFVLKASRTLGFASGWQDIQNVQLELYRNGVHKGTLTCDAAQFNPQTRDARLRGAVHLTFENENGFIDTDKGRLDSASQSFVTNASVVFSSGGMIGRAGRAVYLLSKDKLLLEGGVVIGQEAGQTLRAPRVQYLRNTGQAIFPSGCVLNIGGSLVKAAHAQATMNRDSGKFSSLVLDGGVDITGPGDPGSPSFTAWMEKLTAHSDRDGLWQVTGTTSGRWIEVEIWSPGVTDLKILRTWRIGGVVAQNGPVSFECRPVVCLTEIPPSGGPRTGEAKTAKVWFDKGEPGDIKLAGDVRLSSDQMRATGFSARLLKATASLVLISNPAKTIRATLFSKDSQIAADRIEMSNVKGGAAEARGNVLGFAVSGNGLLSTGEASRAAPVRFAADVLDVSHGGNLLHLRKNARLWEGGKLLLADEVISDRSKGTLQAFGHVRTTFPAGEIQKKEGAGVGDELLIVARSLDFEKSAGVAVYKGNVRYSDNLRILSAAVLTIHFDTRDNVKAVDATGDVHVVDLAENRRMSGDEAHFDLQSKVMTLKGKAVHVTDAQGNVVTGTSLTWNGADGTVTISGGKNAPSETIIHQEGRH